MDNHTHIFIILYRNRNYTWNPRRYEMNVDLSTQRLITIVQCHKALSAYGCMTDSARVYIEAIIHAETTDDNVIPPEIAIQWLDYLQD